jgi:DNA-directed RNA polymerase specialized sigma24 family protein
MTNQNYLSLASLPRDEVLNTIQEAVAEAISAMSEDQVKALMKNGLEEFNAAEQLAA